MGIPWFKILAPPLPASLLDELVEEILLRIPPSDPTTLVRAAVSQKRWCRLVAGPGFRRRYRERHRAPPMLGFFCNPCGSKGFSTWGGMGFSTSFVSASSFRPKPRADCRHLVPVDARHGRVLHCPYEQFPGFITRKEFRLVVWDPITRHRVVLPRPEGLCDGWEWSATVLCAAPAGSCDHLDCHRGHYIVVLIGYDYTRGMLSCVYSSQDGVWSKIIFAPHLGPSLFFLIILGPSLCDKRSAHVGNALYWLDWQHKILKYDLGTLEFSMIEPPPLLSHACSEKIELTTMEEGQLGLAVLLKSRLCILSTDEEFGWGGTKMIDLEKCDNYVPSTTTPSLIGFAGDIGLVFMKAENNGILSVDIRSAQVKVVYKGPCTSWILPYINFCILALGAAFSGEGPSDGGANE